MNSTDQEFNKWIDEGGYKKNGRYILLLWAIALLAANPKYVQLLPFFPLGLFGFFRHEHTGIEAVAGWVGYLVLTLYCLYSRTRTRFLAVLFALGLILLVNVVGCHIVQSKLGKIN